MSCFFLFSTNFRYYVGKKAMFDSDFKTGEFFCTPRTKYCSCWSHLQLPSVWSLRLRGVMWPPGETRGIKTSMNEWAKLNCSTTKFPILYRLILIYLIPVKMLVVRGSVFSVVFFFHYHFVNIVFPSNDDRVSFQGENCCKSMTCCSLQK